MQVSIRSSRRVAAAAFLVGALLAVPVGYVLAAHQFGDVPTSYLFHNDIDAIADAGITSGCGGGNYCPDRYVTRGEMAAFMNRLGALAADKSPVVNADKLDGFTSGNLSRTTFYRSLLLIDPDETATSGTLTGQMEVPAMGWLIVSANVTLYNPTTPANSTCQLKFQGGAALDASYHQTTTGTPITTGQCTSQSFTPVCDTMTYAIDFVVEVGNGVTSAQNATLTIQYTPFQGEGLQPTWLCG